MRYRPYSILYLGLILFYIIRPSLPYIEYAINKDYIERNLCIEKDNPDNSCHGKCYLHEQLNKQQEPADTDRNDKGKLIPDKKLDDHLREYLVFPALYKKVVILSGYYLFTGSGRFISNIFVPPKF
jgi:hypothetical protein